VCATVALPMLPGASASHPQSRRARPLAQVRLELLLDLKNRGLVIVPEPAIAGGAPGFWKAPGELWPTTREQRCWVHKTANLLNKLPKIQQPKAKRSLREIRTAETSKEAEAAFDAFVAAYELTQAPCGVIASRVRSF
jgi:transposase-like protein